MWITFRWLWVGLGSSERSREHSDSVKAEDFLNR
jgi:hypothetical protein